MKNIKRLVELATDLNSALSRAKGKCPHCENTLSDCDSCPVHTELMETVDRLNAEGHGNH